MIDSMRHLDSIFLGGLRAGSDGGGDDVSPMFWWVFCLSILLIFLFAISRYSRFDGLGTLERIFGRGE